jgi:hypothetical protein
MWNPFNFLFVKQDLPSDARETDSYFEKLIKYIPADVVAAWLAIDGILKDQGNHPIWLTWAVFAFLTVLTPLYVVFMKTTPPGFGPTKTFHWMASTLAFVVFVFALGGPFALTFDWYRPLFGTVVLILTTLVLPLLERFFTRQLPQIPTKK